MPHLRRARVAAIARLLRAVAPATRRRRGRVPRQVQPDGIRLEYYREIERLAVEPMRRAFARERDEVVRLLGDVCAREAAARADATSEEDRALALIERAARRVADQISTRELEAAAARYARRTSDFQKEQLSRQVNAAISVPLSAIETPGRDLINLFVKANVELIKTIPNRYFDSLAREVHEAFESGEHPETFAQRLTDRDDVALSDARRIARDQIGKLNGQINQDRQETMGVTGYIWRTVQDERVRDEHSVREGQHFEWDDPPEDGHPGEPIMCRCFAEPDFSQLLEMIAED